MADHAPKNPSTTWYFTDWENDPALKTCSLAAQGLWMRLLCIAARSPEPGIVQIGTLDMSPPHGLTHIASAVGQPPNVITPLIDELLTSGTASRDRKGRLINRRMVRAAGLSQKRAVAGKIGADVTNEKRWKKRVLGRQNVGKPSPLQDFKTSSTSHGEISTGTARPPAPEGAASRTPGLTSHETWRQRLVAYDPHNVRKTWHLTWGPRPDAPGIQPLIPPDLLRWWREQRAAA
jgi:hypothetical protein